MGFCERILRNAARTAASRGEGLESGDSRVLLDSFCEVVDGVAGV